jgi:predicted site-specific integrase-resolvase
MNMDKYIKLSEYAKLKGVHYRTAWRWFHAGLIVGAKQEPTGTILVPIQENKQNSDRHVAIYTRVSSSQNKTNLEGQAERLKAYAAAKGYVIVHIVKEVASGVNDNRQKLDWLLGEQDWDILLVEHKDRLTRVGFNHIKVLLEQLGKKVEVVNLAETQDEDLMQDFVSIITSYCARIYGLRRSRRKTERIIKELQDD